MQSVRDYRQRTTHLYEYIGMTEHDISVSPLVTFIVRHSHSAGIVIYRQVLDLRKITLLFCVFNLVYIPAAIWAMKTANVRRGWSAVAQGLLSPRLRPGGFTADLLFGHHGQHRHHHHAVADILPAVRRRGQGSSTSRTSSSARSTLLSGSLLHLRRRRLHHRRHRGRLLLSSPADRRSNTPTRLPRP